MVADVIPLRPRSTVIGSARSLGGSIQTLPIRLDEIQDDTARAGEVSAAEDLYPDLHQSGTVLSFALALLREADSIMREATAAVDEGDRVSADDAVQRLSALLPELFCCRSLGDSFATVVMSLFHGLAGLHGIPPTAEQISAVADCTRRLRREPFLSYGDALILVSRLENSKLTVEPPTLAMVGEALLE